MLPLKFAIFLRFLRPVEAVLCFRLEHKIPATIFCTMYCVLCTIYVCWGGGSTFILMWQENPESQMEENSFVLVSKFGGPKFDL